MTAGLGGTAGGVLRAGGGGGLRRIFDVGPFDDKLSNVVDANVVGVVVVVGVSSSSQLS